MTSSATEEPGGFRRALDLFEEAASAVPADAWEAPSPCAGWTARDVAGHVIGIQHEIIALTRGETPPDVSHTPARFARPDPLTAWKSARAACQSSLTPEALNRLIPFPGFGDLPLRTLLDTYVLELIVHAWDLATAAALPLHPEPDLIHHALATAQVIAPALRRDGLIAPPRPTPRGAPELTRLLSTLGRNTGFHAPPA
ncbi:TIGR03086 family metal-binding protein [Actinocorallia sp. A-T 12471]|uniref:TIGR03086 family metal-binding protein n=1 Tax=Actinocorallia sp. A-T 12471 TaxID=3089813 RepID=UPI0029CD16D2|nr:TIGR03086 family metal-binding protein [Actinocorallia sp. A-T 12471]MDX6740293.1 TIGR03086 family metal-binding protein [Actinocorallia sp. A-T 12471]